MTFRVGYVNVRGLSTASWKACCALLNTTVDYLFIAETWFVNHPIYEQDRRLIISTPLPDKALQGRRGGGIYLLGTQAAKSEVESVDVTEYSITFTRQKQMITGVYFPPQTLTIGQLQGRLEDVQYSLVILGDLNVRFRDPRHQDGEPGPPRRLQTVTDFMVKASFIHLKPENGIKLTTDHCLIRTWEPISARFRLLLNKPLKMETDHNYTLVLTIGSSITPVQSVPRGSSITRFRTRQLSDPVIREQVLQWIRCHEQQYPKSEEIDLLNANLVEFCQQAQKDTVGEKKSTSFRQGIRVQPPRHLDSQTQTWLASIRLYKSAALLSKENNVITPTPNAQNAGIDATTENLEMLKKRWCGRPFQPLSSQSRHNRVDLLQEWTREQVVAEIEHQESEKSCGADGIHIQFLKAVKDTIIITWLQQLFNQCLGQGRTPRSWNQSEIYLLQKDVDRPKDADNLRPISIICIFRKIFERLLLLRCQSSPWASLHPAQAGFRRSYSTYTNAAVVHHLLSSRTRSTAVFLDFKSAFDVVDHFRLNQKLQQRGCPATLLRLLQTLMFTQMISRLLINDQVTDWFPRTCGVLQGSPLSPWLFNIFVDDLIQEVNESESNLAIPICLFYADDGVIVTNSKMDIQQKLRIVEGWTHRNGIFLNVRKCAVLTWKEELEPLTVYDERLPRVTLINYLGFPFTAHGIDFGTHLQQRVKAAVGRARWLGVQSNSWGPAHRLRIYKQYLAPMFEYGAPLVWAWVKADPANSGHFHVACHEFKDLMAWISNTTDARHLVTANLCGLISLEKRFQLLSTAYHRVLDGMNRENPLQQTYQQAKAHSKLNSFISALMNESDYAAFKKTGDSQPSIRNALSRFLRREMRQAIFIESRSARLTSFIPMESRQKHGLLFADISLSTNLAVQKLLFQYRRGVFMFNSSCRCDANIKFHRGHEDCPALLQRSPLTRQQRQEKLKIRRELSNPDMIFTDVDYLLNIGQVDQAFAFLLTIQQQLRQIYHHQQTTQ